MNLLASILRRVANFRVESEETAGDPSSGSRDWRRRVEQRPADPYDRLQLLRRPGSRPPMPPPAPTEPVWIGWF
ncbi:MAG: hypothetical protein GEU73_09520 [Chloroflexi bacterium]|nr:hypothetical protein [Chloroflexota bacterium]